MMEPGRSQNDVPRRDAKRAVVTRHVGRETATPHSGGLAASPPQDGCHAVTADAQAKLERLVQQLERHRESAREYGLAGYVTMTERHRRLMKLVADEIRRHCLANGLDVPEGLPPEEADEPR
jgi:hypothetical protein